MARFLHHENCPKCGSRDNLGRYDDGSAHCFGCAYYEPPTHAPRRTVKEKKHAEESGIPKMPDDAGTNYSAEAVAWLAQYHLSVEDAIKANFLWSPNRRQLIFVLEDGCWQARNFSIGNKNEAKRSKYFTAGNVNDSIKLYLTKSNVPSVCGESSGSALPGQPALVEDGTATLTIVEDCVSAYRVSALCDAMPMLGSNVSKAKLNRLARLYSSLILWHDSDKLVESRKIADQAKMLGLSTKVIHTDLDPKCYTTEQLKELLSC